MKYQKRRITAFTSGGLTLVLALSACGGSGLSNSGGGGNHTGVVTLGVSAPMSGDAAGWGVASKWLTEKAVKELNDAGGVKTGKGTVTFKVAAQDNEYTAAGGARAAQTLLNGDHADFISFSVGTAPVQALQSMTEKKHILMMTSAWGKDLKGPKFPYTFTVINTPFEVLNPLARFVLGEHPDAQDVALIGMNDATGHQTEAVAQDVWKGLGKKVVSSDFYEQGTTEWAPIATKLISKRSDILDMTTVTPGAAGLLLRALHDQGWKGVTMLSAGTGGSALIKSAGGASEGVYMGLAADYSSDKATQKQRELEAGLVKATGETLNGVTIGAYDAVKAIAAAIKKAGTTDSDAVRKAMSTVVWDASYGPTAFGAQSVYGSPQQILVPMIVTQIKSGKVVERERIIPQELKDRTS